MKPIAYTPGEPAGIGPDIILQQAIEGFDVPTIAIASAHLLRERAITLSYKVDVLEVNQEELDTLESIPGQLHVLDVPLKAEVTLGQLDVDNAGYVLETLNTAVRLALTQRISALVTGPVHKGIINEAGLPFTGHTEYLRDHSDTSEVVMMLATEGLRVALVTTHLPLKDVSKSITQDKILRITRILHASLVNHFGCQEPTILVAGLNPHAGENGHLGTEEIETIVPALNQLKAENIQTTGPLPADTLFQPHYLETADAVLAMYHDQGLPVLKYKGFGNAVNITLGLPFIRTSVDHGTALDLAGTGQANSGSLKVALKYAADMATLREQIHASS